MEGHYMALVSKRSQVADLGGHRIYHIDDTQFVPIHVRSDGLLHPHEQQYDRMARPPAYARAAPSLTLAWGSRSRGG